MSTRSNLPPGCTSPDGGIDHIYEQALERLVDAIETSEECEALLALLPGVRQVLATSYSAGAGDGRLEVELTDDIGVD